MNKALFPRGTRDYIITDDQRGTPVIIIAQSETAAATKYAAQHRSGKTVDYEPAPMEGRGSPRSFCFTDPFEIEHRCVVMGRKWCNACAEWGDDCKAIMRALEGNTQTKPVEA